MPNDWLKDKHPIYVKREVEWRRNERRLRGGIHVLPELRKFDWETSPNEILMEQELQDVLAHKDDIPAVIAAAPGQHYAMRQSQAMYINFPDSFMALLVGHLVRKAPTPDNGIDFGTLGKVRRTRDAQPTDAELIFFNTDGVGNDGSQWGAFWANVERWSGATGHRWLLAEAPTKGASSRAEVLLGRRPYLVHLSPLDITNWDFVEGRLAWAVHQLAPVAAKVKDGKLGRNHVGPRRLYVRKGFDGLGPDYQGGGWWTFNPDGTLVTGDGAQGVWEKTDGEIPMWPHFYERDTEYFSRPGVTELGNAAVAVMNLDSAANFDAWDAAKSETYFVNVDTQGFEVAVKKRSDGSQWIPIPAGAESGPTTQVVDSAAGAVPAEVFQKRLTSIMDAVRQIANMEASSGADSSGISKLLGFQETRSPRLAMMASEIETSQNIAIFFLEQRFGNGTPKGSVSWPREFDLKPVMDNVQAMLDLQDSSGIRSETVTVGAMMQGVKEIGLAGSDAEEQKIRGEYEASAREVSDQRKQAAALVSEFGGSGTSAQAKPPTGAKVDEPAAPAA